MDSVHEITPTTPINTATPQFNLQDVFRSTEQRRRREIARKVAELWDDIAREAGFSPAERRAAWAVTIKLYEYETDMPETPRRVSLANIGKALASRSDDQEARERTARNRMGVLFNEAIPRTGCQILTRLKAEEGSNEAHAYIDHLFPVAVFFSELLAEEIKAINSNKSMSKDQRAAAREAARARLIAEAIGYLPKCDTKLTDAEGQTYAYMAQTTAIAYQRQRPELKVEAFKYEPPAEKPPQPFYSEDFDKIEQRIINVIERELDEIRERNSFDEARLAWLRFEKKILRAGASWVKVSAGRQREREEEAEGIISAENTLTPPVPVEPVLAIEAVEKYPDFETEPPENFSPYPPDNFSETSDLETQFFESSENTDFQDVDISTPETALEPERLEGSINFESALEAALFYARDGWPVLPICQFDPDAGRCTGNRHPETCTGKKPLVKGDGIGPGYTAATTDRAKIRKWFEYQFPTAGVGLRLDGHVLIDCDVKDGARGIESYELLRDTFGLPETLTAVTHSGGRHYVFKLPADLPAEILKSWTRALEPVGLGGIDLKVDKCGLLFAEPTRGSKGVYRWVNYEIEPAVLPLEVCQFIHDAYTKDKQAKAANKTETSTATTEEPIDTTDQSKFFRDVPQGQGQHKRLLKIGVSVRTKAGKSESEIAEIMRWHAKQFTQPLNDEAWITRTARSIASKY